MVKDTREHILETSLRLFLKSSYKEVTLQEIVNETGLSKGAFYHYFNSKEKIFEEVVEYFYEDRINADYYSYPNNSLKKFYLAVIDRTRENVAQIDEQRDNSNLVVFVTEASKRLPHFAELQKKHHANELTCWKNAVKNAKTNGEIHSKLSDTDIAQMFICLSDGILLEYSLSQDSPKKSVQELKKLFDNLFALLV
jgi:AcrR family transcriptional regulator